MNAFLLTITMGRKSKHAIASARRAREGKARGRADGAQPHAKAVCETSPPDFEISESDSECHWDGGVNNIALDSDSESDGDWQTDSDAESELSELEGEELVESLQTQLQNELKSLSVPSPYEVISQSHTSEDWTKAEGNRSLGYNKLSDRTKRRREHDAREKEKLDSVERKR